MRQLAEEEAKALLASEKMGRLGCVHEGEPYVVPINYVFEDGFIYSHSLPGRKIDALRQKPRACLQVDVIVNDFNWRSAVAFGNFEEIQNPSERGTILGKLLFHFPNLTPVESVIAEDAYAQASIVFRIAVDYITGVEEA